MYPGIPGNFAKDSYGNAAPLFGGSEAVDYFPFTFAMITDTTAFRLPPGAIIVSMSYVVNDTFDGGATLDVGHTSADTYYLNGGALGTGGPVYATSWSTKGKWFTQLTSPEDIVIKVTGSPTVGAGVLAVRYRLG